MVNELIENDSLGTGKLARSIEEVVDENKQELTILMLEYGIYVDGGFGRGPGKRPPVQPLINWIKNKNIRVPAGLTVRGFAFAIANKIGRVGTNPRPRPFIQPSINIQEKWFNDSLAEAGLEDFDNSLQMVFKETGGTVR